MALNRAGITHLLNRAGFGATPADIDRFRGLDRSEAVDLLLDFQPISDPLPPIVDAGDAGDELWWERYVALVHWWHNRMISTPNPLQEKLTLFWHGHFTSGIDKVGSFAMIGDQNRLLRANCAGSFTDLCQAVSIDPAMLMYLDNWLNLAGSAQENFSRELMELFTMGSRDRAGNPNYSELDVAEAARAWTGYGVAWDDVNDRRAYTYRPENHDNGLKTFQGISRRWTGPQIIDWITEPGSPQRLTTARFLSRKLWLFFGNAAPSTSAIDAVAGAMDRNDLSIDRGVRRLLVHNEFWESKSAVVRSPTELLVAIERALDLGPEVIHPEWFGRSMGQHLFDPPNVSGWKTHGYWLSPTSQWTRAQIMDWVRYQLFWSEAGDRGFLADSASKRPSDAADDVVALFNIRTPRARELRLKLARAVRRIRATEPWYERELLVGLTILSPDFNLA